MAVFAPQWQSWVLTKETVWPANLKVFTIREWLLASEEICCQTQTSNSKNKFEKKVAGLILPDLKTYKFTIIKKV